jgi:hypothetical protein
MQTTKPTFEDSYRAVAKSLKEDPQADGPLTVPSGDFVESNLAILAAREPREALTQRSSFAVEACDRALALMREQPGRAALVTFGAGLGLGLILLGRSRSYAQRLVFPTAMAVAQILRQALQERDA